MTRREILSLIAAGLWSRPRVISFHERRQSLDGMRLLADRARIRWGVMVPAAHVGSALDRDTLYRARCLDNFNALAIPDFGWMRVEREQDVWQLEAINAATDFAMGARMTVMGMHLLWGHPSQIPAWLRRSADSGSVRALVLRHVGHIAQAMRGRVAVWSVLNELEGAPWVPGSDFWRRVLTVEDIVEVFQRVREEDGKGTLLINDFGVEVPGGAGYFEDRRDRLLQLVKELRSLGAPIGAVGFQMHLNAGDFGNMSIRRRRMSLFQDNIRSFQDSGVQVCVTELDVRVDEVEGSVADRLSIQAGVYESVLQTAVEAGISSVNFWGLSDRYATDMRTGRVFPTPGPLLFDASMLPKTSYYTAESVLRTWVSGRSEIPQSKPP